MYSWYGPRVCVVIEETAKSPSLVSRTSTMSRNAGPPPDASKWQAQYLRLIAFPITSQLSDQRAWWRELTGSDPDVSVRKKTGVEQSGQYGGAQLVVNIDPIRIQWTTAEQI